MSTQRRLLDAIADLPEPYRERLRASLGRPQGERTSPPRRPPSRLAVAGVAALAALAAVTVVGGGPGHELAGRFVIGAATAGPGPNAGKPPGPDGSSLPACHQRLTALRRESLQLERALWVRGHHRSLFPLGADNPAAAQVLLPLVTHIVRAGRAEPPALTLECRTFACELRVVERGEAGRSLWQRAIQNDGRLRQHRRGLGFIAERPARHPGPGGRIVEYRFGFTLRHPSGGALDWDGPPVGPDALAAMASFLPAGVEECAAQASGLERMLATRREGAARGF